jgi:hypothetical protein
MGHRGPVDDPGPNAPGYSEAAHAMFVVEGWLAVDLTRRRFDWNAPVPTIYGSTFDLGRHWKMIVVADRYDMAPPIVLPDPDRIPLALHPPALRWDRG